MTKLLDRLTGQGAAPWLNFTDYAAALLLGSNTDWLDINRTAAWIRQAQGLLGSAVIEVDLRAVTVQWLNRDADLRLAMAAKSRPAYPLRTLLDTSDLRSHIASLVSSVAASLPGVPLVCIIPSPSTWVAQAHRAAFPSDELEVDDDLVDTAACYVADFARELPERCVDAVLVDASGDARPLSDDQIALLQPIFNVARHYRWSAGVLAPQSPWIATPSSDGPDFVISPIVVSGYRTGLAIDPSFWSGLVPPPERSPNCFLYAQIPKDATPEQVLRQIALLR